MFKAVCCSTTAGSETISTGSTTPTCRDCTNPSSAPAGAKRSSSPGSISSLPELNVDSSEELLSPTAA